MDKLFCLILLIRVLFSFFTPEPGKIKGSGYVLTQQRETPAFDSIETSDEVKVFVVQGDLQPIVVEADDNLFPYIKTLVRGNVLKIYITDTVRITKYAAMNVLLSIPHLKSLKATTRGKIDASPQQWKLGNVQIKAATGGTVKLRCEADTIQVKACTSGNVELKGKVRQLDVNLKTTAQLEARELKVSEAVVKLATGAKAELQVHQEIQYDLSGNTRLQLWGKPFIPSSSLTSGSQLIRRK